MVGFIWGRWIHLGSRWGSLGISGVVVFTCVRPWGRWVPLWSFGSIGFTLGIVGFALGVVRFIWSRCVHLGSCWGSFGLSRAAGFTQVRDGNHWVHPGSLG